MWKYEVKIIFYDVSTLERDVKTYIWAMRAHIAPALWLPSVVALVVLLVSLELLVAALQVAEMAMVRTLVDTLMANVFLCLFVIFE